MAQPQWLVIKAQKACLPNQQDLSPATVVIDRSTGRFAQVDTDASKVELPTDNVEVWELNQEQVLFPGLVDAHVHLNEPGRTEWEGFETGTKAAAAGGVTTVVDMPLNAIPPTTTVENFEIKMKAAKGQCHVDTGFWGGVVPDNAQDLPGLMDRGVRGFKCFLIESGVDEFPCVTEADLRRAMDQMVGRDRMLLFHAELDTGVDAGTKDPKTYESFLDSRPQKWETSAIDLIINLTREYAQAGRPVRTHIVHLSASSAIPAIRAAKAEGLPLTVETCFHYLHFTAEEIPDGATHYKCCPPIREKGNREALWEALLDGTIDYVVSDHSPCTPQLKKLEKGQFDDAWGGIASVQFGLPALWTESRQRGVSPARVAHWLSYAPSQHAQLHHKGAIQVGRDADVVVWQPEASYTISTKDIHFKNKLSPYVDQTLYGKVDRTVVRGQTVFDCERSGYFLAEPVGQLVLDGKRS